MLFMSATHVETMNDLLAQSGEVRAMAADLGRELVIMYDLKSGPEGAPMYWTLRVGSQGVCFALTPSDQQPDVTLRADWAAMIQSAKANREGRQHQEVDIEFVGDKSVLTSIAPLMAAVRRVASVECEFPDA
jgi:hypothetical protein